MSPSDLPTYELKLAAPRFWPIWFLLAGLRLLVLLPYRWLMPLGSALGRLFFFLAPSRRRIAEINIELCFPELDATQRAAMLRANARSTGMGIVESLYACWGRNPPQTIEWQGEEILQAAMAQGRGVLLVGLHMTCLDIIGRLINARYHMDYLEQERRNPLLRAVTTRARRRYFNEAIERKATHHLRRCLRQGHIVWYAPDQDHGLTHGVFSNFFGVPAATVTALARIASFYDTPVVFIHYHRLEQTLGYGITFESAGDFPTGDSEKDARRINDFLEHAIRQHPDQYLWVHRKFKTRPPGMPELYRRKDGRRYGD